MVYACGSLVMCCHWHGDFPILTVVSSFPFHFLDSHGVVGYPFGFLIGSPQEMIGSPISYGCELEQILCGFSY